MEYINISDANMNNISIIIPATRNKDIFILLKRLNDQITEGDEIIVVADTQKIDTYMLKKKFSKVRLINEKNNSPARARNLGINIAEKDFLLFLDDDILPDSLLIKDYKDILYSEKQCFGIAGSIKPYCNNSMLKRYYNAQRFSWRHDAEKKVFVTCNLLLKNEGIRFDERFSFAFEDVALSKTLEDKNILISKGCLVYHKMPETLFLFIKKFLKYGMGKKMYEKANYSLSKDDDKIKIFNTMYGYYEKFNIYKALGLCILETIKYFAYYSGYIYESIKKSV